MLLKKKLKNNSYYKIQLLNNKFLILINIFQKLWCQIYNHKNLLDLKSDIGKRLEDVIKLPNKLDEYEDLQTRKNQEQPRFTIESIREQDEPVQNMQTTVSWMQDDVDIRKSIVANKIISQEAQYD